VLLNVRMARNPRSKLKQPNSAFGWSTDRAPPSWRSVHTSARNAKPVRRPIPSATIPRRRATTRRCCREDHSSLRMTNSGPATLITRRYVQSLERQLRDANQHQTNSSSALVFDPLPELPSRLVRSSPRSGTPRCPSLTPPFVHTHPFSQAVAHPFSIPEPALSLPPVCFKRSDNRYEPLTDPTGYPGANGPKPPTLESARSLTRPRSKRASTPRLLLISC
jgi:hypothetical protein